MKATKYIHTDNFDLTACDMARVSFNKRAENYSKEQNSRLINYLIKHNHWTPFAHTHLSFRLTNVTEYELLEILMDKNLSAGLHLSEYEGDFILSGSIWALLTLLCKHPKWGQLIAFIQELAPITLNTFRDYNYFKATYDIDIEPFVSNDSIHIYKTIHLKVPIFVARQLDKHVVSFVKNEVSRRYISDTPTFFQPEYWRGKAKDKKQGSSKDIIEFNGYQEYTEGLKELYEKALKENVCEEQARMILPQSMYTEYYLTSNMDGWNRLLTLRLKEDTQLETNLLAKQIEEVL